jgi:hypothetical protein
VFLIIVLIFNWSFHLSVSFLNSSKKMKIDFFNFIALFKAFFITLKCLKTRQLLTVKRQKKLLAEHSRRSMFVWMLFRGNGNRKNVLVSCYFLYCFLLLFTSLRVISSTNDIKTEAQGKKKFRTISMQSSPLLKTVEVCLVLIVVIKELSFLNVG